MTNSKTTKRALIASVLSLLVCFSMLIGSTFAWFTDTATTGVNTIQSGNLDIKLSYKNATVTSWTEVSENDKLFDDNALWEPGYTEVAYLKVENKGSLALKYQLTVNVLNEVIGKNIDGGDIKLSEILKYDLIELTSDTTYADRAAALAAVSDAKNLMTETVSDTMEAEATAKYYALVVYMPIDVNNNANHNGTNIPSIQLGVNVNATQYTSESDTFGNDYDEDAQLSKQINVHNQTELHSVISEATATDTTKLVLADGNYVLPTDSTMQNKNITISGSEDVVIDYTNMGNVFGWAQDNIGTVLTFDGVTVNWQTGNQGYQGIKNPARVIYKNCTITGTQFMYSGADFINCTFTSTDYCVYLRANGDYTFTGCTFNTDGKAIMMYHDQGNTANVVLTDCKFYSNDTITGKAAVETGDDSKTCVYNITFVNCTQEGFDINPNGISTNSELWGNKNSIPTDRLNVIINGVDVY